MTALTEFEIEALGSAVSALNDKAAVEKAKGHHREAEQLGAEASALTNLYARARTIQAMAS